MGIGCAAAIDGLQRTPKLKWSIASDWYALRTRVTAR